MLQWLAPNFSGQFRGSQKFSLGPTEMPTLAAGEAKEVLPYKIFLDFPLFWQIFKNEAYFYLKL